MKVLFINPNRDTFGFKPIGISILSALAKRGGWSTKLLDLTQYDLGDEGFDSRQVYETSKLFKPVDFSGYNLEKEKITLNDAVVRELDTYNPDLVAITVMSDQHRIAEEITGYIKEVPIMWGGPYATLNPERTLSEHKADLVCVGEGLESFPEVLEAIELGTTPETILNIWTRNESTIIKNTVRPLKENLDELPYLDWDIFPQSQFPKPYNGKVVIGGDHMLTWGCPNHCTYCINHFYHQLYPRYPIRGYTTDRIIAELKHLTKKHGIEFYKFHDENFLLRPLENFRELSEAYRKEINVPFAMMCNARSATPEKVRLLKEMNCVSISFGLECGDFELRKTVLNRIDTKEDILNCVRLFNDAKIRTSSFNMLGLPFYSREVYQKTVDLNREANTQYPNASFFFPYEGTLLRDISIKNGFFDEFSDAVYKEGEPNLHFENLSRNELIEMHRCFVQYIKLPKEYGMFIRRSEVRDSIGDKLKVKLGEIYDTTVFKNDGWYNNEGNKSRYLLELRELMR